MINSINQIIYSSVAKYGPYTHPGFIPSGMNFLLKIISGRGFPKQCSLELQHYVGTETQSQDLPIKTVVLLRMPSHLLMSCCRDATEIEGCCRDGGCANGCPLISIEDHDALQLLFTMNIFHSIPLGTYCVQSTMLKIMR